MIRLVVAAALLIPLAACSKTTLVMHDPVLDAPNHTASNPTQAHEIANPYVLRGFGQRHRVNLTKLCNGRDNILKIQVNSTIITSLFNFLSFGFYAPREILVFCRTPPPTLNLRPTHAS